MKLHPFFRSCLWVFGEIRDPHVIPSTPLYLVTTDCLFSKLKKCNKRDEIWRCFIDPTDCDKRTESDTGRRVFSGIQFILWTMYVLCWSVQGLHLVMVLINIFQFMWFLWPQFGNLIVTLCIWSEESPHAIQHSVKIVVWYVVTAVTDMTFFSKLFQMANMGPSSISTRTCATW
jgi:hypothetical protein